MDEDFENQITTGTLKWHESFELEESAEGWLYSTPISVQQLKEWIQFSSNYIKPDSKTYITYYILDLNYNEKANFVASATSPEIKNITFLNTIGNPNNPTEIINPIILKAHLKSEKSGTTPAIEDWRIDYRIDPNPPDILTVQLQTEPYAGGVFLDPAEIYKSDKITITSLSGDESSIESHIIQCKKKQLDGTWQDLPNFPKEWSAGGSHSVVFDPFYFNTGDTIRYWAEAKDVQGNFKSTNELSQFTVLNHNPTAAMSCEVVSCGKDHLGNEMPGCECSPSFLNNWTTYNGNGVLFKINNNSEELDGPNDALSSTWSIVGYQDPYVSYAGCGMSAPSTVCSGADMTMPTNIPAGNYVIQLKVEDSDHATDTITHTIKVKQDIIVHFECSLMDPSSMPPGDYSNWQDCENIKAGVSAMVYSNDNLPDPHKHSSASTGASITSRKWSKDGIELSSGNFSSFSILMESITHEVLLIAKDSIGREGSESHTITVGQLLPKYKEISPFKSLREINFAQASSFLKNIFGLE